MRHNNAGRKFDRNTSSRKSMFRNLTANLVLNERIETTEAKAKELRRVAERLITKAIRLGEISYTPQEKLSDVDKGKRLATKRLISAFLPRWGTSVAKGGETKKVDLVEKVMLDLAKRFSKRPGGYTRTVKMGQRRGDNAPLVIIEFVDQASAVEGEGGEKKAKKAAPKKAAASKKTAKAAAAAG
ncbi:MAG: ribosomal protein L17p [Myxococcaceae bacterium]|jgi:large subunit ribosomal protein L17|nr:ribosomal protein L17p [Myxococcaceae bacterium]MEA2747332.1 large subunit ribosomal protein [Myxococcales bacterium]